MFSVVLESLKMISFSSKYSHVSQIIFGVLRLPFHLLIDRFVKYLVALGCPYSRMKPFKKLTGTPSTVGFTAWPLSLKGGNQSHL